ncbi:UL51 protein [Gallid alphaherpesvirus 3]|uniref:UL51 protein n=1 Tax=Gallid alphaherpesvirus 3 TaxID=35250 RepID=F8TC50_9ALPH|nr:UL51 protein [Gallid alphaherpesvirus 3]AEI00261.1 UL51 protein [Gallid alphaherpesvirus 3]QEY02272.1 UL51 protein [Gallid alphaherpesvirus 3]
MHAGLRRRSRKIQPEYTALSTSSSSDRVMHRFREAVQAVNLMLPTPITLEMAILSADGVRKLVRGQSLARMYSACLRNLDCLSRHVSGQGTPGLDAVVETHRKNAQRMVDTCAAALLQIYMSVGTGRTDAFVEHAIQITAATETAMNDIALVERALGLKSSPNDCSLEALAACPETENLELSEATDPRNCGDESGADIYGRVGGLPSPPHSEAEQAACATSCDVSKGSGRRAKTCGVNEGMLPDCVTE